MITIGVTGHRILAEIEKVTAGIEEALNIIKDRFPDEKWWVMSQLAEGTDRLVAKAVLSVNGSKLIAVLPLPQEDYETDFKTEQSKSEFRELLSQATDVIELPKLETRRLAYEIAGKYVLDHSSVLLTVWDGRTAQAQGGTGDIVALARQRSLLIAWVHAANRKPGTHEPTTLGEEQGKVTFENFLI